jgi:hypothetical protein
VSIIILVPLVSNIFYLIVDFEEVFYIYFRFYIFIALVFEEKQKETTEYRISCPSLTEYLTDVVE